MKAAESIPNLPVALHKRSPHRARQQRTAAFFLLPSMVVLFVFMFYPILETMWISLHKWNLLNPTHKFFGLYNYTQLFKDPVFWKAMGNTVYFTVGSVPVGIAISLGLALLVNEPLKGLKIFRTVYFLPVISSFAVISIIWSFLMNPDIGLLSYYERLVGLPVVNWLGEPGWAMLGVIIVAVWKNVGLNLVILLAGLQAIPKDLYEAANIDGSGAWRRFWNITLPMLRHPLLFVTITSALASFQVFDEIYVMTRGGPLFSTETIVYYIYEQGFGRLDMGMASSAAWILFLIIFVVTIIQLKFFKFNEVE
jgi:multiple sugar transport system permease protein